MQLDVQDFDVPTSFAVISSKGADRLLAGHPWIYRGDVVRVSAEGGDIVAVRGPRDRMFGTALYSSRSQIALRMLEYGEDAPADGAAIVRARLATAIRFRETLRIEASAYRLVHGESDLLPSLVVDRYGDYLVIQTLSQGMDRLLPDVVSALDEQLHPRGILARNDPRVRS